MNGNGNGKHDYQHMNGHARRMTEIALRGTALLWDLQADAARNLLETQASSAAMLGAPDLSQVFHVGEGPAKGMFSQTVDQALKSLRQINDTVSEVQWQLTRVAEQQTFGLAQRIQKNVEQLSRRSQQGLEEIRRLAEEEAEEVEQMAREADAQWQMRNEEQDNRSTGRRRRSKRRASA
jgi:gas vesicle protein